MTALPAGVAHFCLAPRLPKEIRHQERETALFVGSAQLAAGVCFGLRGDLEEWLEGAISPETLICEQEPFHPKIKMIPQEVSSIRIELTSCGSF